MRAAATRRQFAPNAMITGQGEDSKQFYVVLHGQIRVMAGSAHGREVVLAVCGPGEILGELSAIDGRPRSATLQAVDTVDVLLIPDARLPSLCDAYPRIAWSLLQVVVRRLRDTDQQRAEYSGGTSTQRVVALLLDLAERWGQQVADGVRIDTPATQQKLAETASTSRESMARVLRSLRAKGLITTGRRWIVIHRLADLRAMGR
ncbi:Crp/Fnr family transcriptional regulator [Kutzneria viridogrisea]|uniref:Crp/Fnr family transcription regulator n=2 Tax=Kutzneria TaxID=43356 RepID=W5W731_9PSEU|nr:Crp/Fnr family transcriptional regulator [Kutzneria albida]AHH96341.1 hypothetical protein KALB_2973 [Kutzneria albida DSM 43870]MBA8928444.1 CRP-like cAMP-binding protein [Kutzneria viridogrisea]